MTNTLTPSPGTPEPEQSAPSFAVSVSDAPDGSVVTLSGELDMATAPQLTAALNRLRRNDSGPTTLDCSSLTFCDSSGLAALIRAHQHHQARGNHLRITASPPILQRLLALTGLDSYLDTRLSD